MVQENNKKVLCFGTFDILHPGHVSFLKQARKYGNYLVVVVARDENVKKIKGKYPLDNELKRIENL
ncbi:MAG: adenylyltransferase/cytidyltransferase family protein, partial [Promethearchaeota archaeon]